FQAEDGIRDFHVTGVQTCALPICRGRLMPALPQPAGRAEGCAPAVLDAALAAAGIAGPRSALTASADDAARAAAEIGFPVALKKIGRASCRESGSRTGRAGTRTQA